MSDHNLYHRIERSLLAAGQRIIFRESGKDSTLSADQLRQGVARYANALAVLGVAVGDRVTVQTEKSLAAVMLYLAVLKSGAVYQPLNTAYTASEVDYFVGDANPALIVCDPSRQSTMREIADRHRVTAVVNLDSEGHGSVAELAALMDDRHDTVSRSADDLAGLLYTSGTTGRSKGAMITHGNLISNAEALIDLWRITEKDVLIHALPIFHVHGLYVALNTTLIAGSEIIWLPKFDAARVIGHLPEATLMMGVPTFYTRLLATPEFDSSRCKSIRLFISGSAPLLAETHKAFAARTGHQILERYGMTETGMITSNPYDGERVAGSVGYALPGVSVRIRGEQPGVIEVKGPNVFRGYWRMPEKTAEDFTEDGYFVTGDLGTMAVDGRISIVGRAKDLIISGGFNVYPKEVEDVIDALPGVTESAVVGIPHPDFGEAVIAAVTTASGLLPEAEMIAALSRHLAKFKVPKRIIALDELPRNAMGKVQKQELRKRYGHLFATM